MNIFMTTNRKKIWKAIGHVKSALATYNKNPDVYNDIQVIEYEMIEKKRYNIICRNPEEKYGLRKFDLVSTKDRVSESEPIIQETPDQNIDWSKI